MWQQWQQWRSGKEAWQQAKWLAVDIETNGLDSRKDAMLSIAWVPIQPPRIVLGSSAYRVVQSAVNLNQSAVVHQLSQADIAAGEPLLAVLSAFAAAAKDSYLVCHNAQFDVEVLLASCKQSGDVGLQQWRPHGVYCTLQAERKRLQRRGVALHTGDLTLAGCRSRYGLAEFAGHHALNDAIACAELFLAQAYRFSGNSHTAVAQLLREGR